MKVHLIVTPYMGSMATRSAANAPYVPCGVWPVGMSTTVKASVDCRRCLRHFPHSWTPEQAAMMLEDRKALPRNMRNR